MLAFLFLSGFLLASNAFFMLPKLPRMATTELMYRRNYPLSPRYYEEAIKRLNSRNITTQTNSILNEFEHDRENGTYTQDDLPQIQIILGGFLGNSIFGGGPMSPDDDPFGDDDDDDDDYNNQKKYRRGGGGQEKLKSKNFQVIKTHDTKFKNVGGYKEIKEELKQSVDILKNYHKYANYNVRVPKGLILEGPPGNGKTMLAKALAGECRCGFIAVSGSDFQEKYVGVGSSRIRELFELAKKNEPCIIFIDEIDAVGRRRSGDAEASSSERDNTLNSLLVELDGFKNNTGIFLVGATNRIDLLDSALTRPGRIDKKIFVGLPDANTRRAVLKIHVNGKPHDKTVNSDYLVEETDGFSCAQIENLLNEAMLYALRNNRKEFTSDDVDVILNKIITGWQPGDHEFTQDMIERISVHEMGHAILGFLSKYHSKMMKVVLNLSSPNTPGYTMFERAGSSIYLKEALFEHLVILLGGRIAEEVVYNVSITTGAINDFEEALKLAEKMIVYYGMGAKILYPSNSEKYLEIIDDEVNVLINNAYLVGHLVLDNCKPAIEKLANRLQKDKQLKYADFEEIIQKEYPELLDLRL